MTTDVLTQDAERDCFIWDSQWVDWFISGICTGV